jgi:Fe-S-cluster-containing hydrogenase component 2
MSLSVIFKQRKCFKLVCGAGNEDAAEVEKLVAVYALAGTNYFDLSAKPEIVSAAWKGLDRVIPKNKQGDYYLNVSVGIKGDPHVRKAVIDPEKCKVCGLCEKECEQKAIIKKDNTYSVVTAKCIGCGKCDKVCPVAAINYITINKDLNEVLPPLIKMGISSIELHAVTDDEEGAYEQWKIINKCFSGMLSLCLDRSHLGDKALIRRINRFIDGREKFTTIIQADGAPMSGSDDKPNTTLQALATADVVQKANLPVWILLSGGTNSTTTELAKLFELDAHGVAIGSFARKIIKQYINREDFLENKEIFSAAHAIAKQLVDKSLRYMGNDNA